MCWDRTHTCTPQRIRGARYQVLVPSGPVRRNGGQAMWLRTHAEREVYAEKTQPAGYNRRSPQSGVSVRWPVCAQVSASLGLELLGEDPTGGGVAPSAGQTAGRVAPSPRTPSDGVPRPSLKVCSSSTPPFTPSCFPWGPSEKGTKLLGWMERPGSQLRL